jgi:hypothetical protein
MSIAATANAVAPAAAVTVAGMVSQQDPNPTDKGFP